LLTYSNTPPDEMKQIEKFSPIVFDKIVFDKTNPLSVLNNIINSRENARSIQEHIAKEVWQCLNEYYHFIRHPQVQQQMKHGDPVSSFDLLIRHCYMYTGIVDTTMSRGEGITYLNIGRFLERTILTIDTVRIKLIETSYPSNENEEAPELRYLLYALYGYEQYVKTFRGSFQTDFVLQHVVLNAEFPHSVMYSLQQMNKYFERLRGDSLPEYFNEVEFLLGKVMNTVKYTSSLSGNRDMIRKFLVQVRNELFTIASTFSHHYFGHA
jgi:uncharacterized alpha-E superfamily protein